MALAIALSPLKSHAQEFTKREPKLERIFDHSKEWHPFYKDIHCKAVVNKDNKLLIHVKAVWNGKKFNGPINDKVVLEGYIDPKDEYFRKNETILASGCSDKALYVVTNEQIITMPYGKAWFLFSALSKNVYVLWEKSIVFTSKIGRGQQAMIDSINNVVYVLGETKKEKNNNRLSLFEIPEKDANKGIFVYSVVGKKNKIIDLEYVDNTFRWTDIEKIKLCKEGVCAYDSEGRYIGSIRYVYDPKEKTVVKVERNEDLTLNSSHRKGP